MTTADRRPPVQPGERAPAFSLPAVHREGVGSLADYRGTSPLLLAIFRGLWCPFCRRAIAELGAVSARLRALGVETLGIVATNVDNARLYFTHRPTRASLVADPECTTHRACGLPQAPKTGEVLQPLKETRVNPTGELAEPMPIVEAVQALDRLNRFQPTNTDHGDADRQFGQLKGQFLVDRESLVRWANVECAAEGLPGFGKFPTLDELLTAARLVA
jgi:peroxiredoxin